MTLKNHNNNQIILCKRAKMDLMEWVNKYAKLYRKQNLKIVFLPKKEEKI